MTNTPAEKLGRLVILANELASLDPLESEASRKRWLGAFGALLDHAPDELIDEVAAVVARYEAQR